MGKVCKKSKTPNNMPLYPMLPKVALRYISSYLLEGEGSHPLNVQDCVFLIIAIFFLRCGEKRTPSPFTE